MTANELFRKAHQIARQIRGEYKSYREAFVAGLAAARIPAKKVYVFTGDTYPHRKAFAAVTGAKWEGSRKAWIVPAQRDGKLCKSLRSLRGVSWRVESI